MLMNLQNKYALFWRTFGEQNDMLVFELMTTVRCENNVEWIDFLVLIVFLICYVKKKRGILE